jgi:hypothetical protein
MGDDEVVHGDRLRECTRRSRFFQATAFATAMKRAAWNVNSVRARS